MFRLAMELAQLWKSGPSGPRQACTINFMPWSIYENKSSHICSKAFHLRSLSVVATNDDFWGSHAHSLGPGRVAPAPLKQNVHAFRSCSHLGVMIACLRYHRVDHMVAVIGIVVEQDKFLCSALHHDIDGFAPMAVPPASLACLVLFWKILRVVNKHVGALRQPPHALVEDRVSRLVVGRIDQHLALGFNPEP